MWLKTALSSTDIDIYAHFLSGGECDKKIGAYLIPAW